MSEKEGAKKFSILSLSFGLVGLIFSIIQPVAGIISGIIGLFLYSKQRKHGMDDWSKAAKILNILAIVISILIIILGILAFNYLSKNPGALAQLQGTV